MSFIQDLLRALRLPTNSRRRSTRSRRLGFCSAAESVEPRMMLTASFTTSSVPMNSAGMLGLVAGDFNGDTNPDFAVSNNSGFIDVVSGNGNGNFGTHVAVNTGVPSPVAFSIASGNITGDGLPELVVGSFGGNNVRIMNNGSGSFTQGALVDTGGVTTGVAVGDLNNDGVNDIVSSRYTLSSVRVSYMNSLGVEIGSRIITTGANPSEVIIADLDGDSIPDIVTANETAKSLTVIRNLGGDTYASPITLVTSGLTGAFGVGGVHAANLDGAGGLDLVVTNPTSGTIDYFQNTGVVSFTLQQTITVGGIAPVGLTSLDFDGDTDLDLAVACRDSNSVRLFRNDGGTFVFDGSLAAPTPFEIVAADFNKDGQPDLAVSSQGSSVVTVLINSINLPPVITSNGGGASAAINAAENQTAVTTVTATDGNVPAQTLTYSITGGADQALFSIVGGTGVLTFAAAPDFENPTDAGSNGVYDVQVTVTDSGVGNLTDVQNVAVTVTNVNDAPVITSNGGGPTAAINAAENQTAVATVTATDQDQPPQTLTYTISGGADAGKFSIVAGTGVLTFVAAPDFENKTDADNNNIYDVQVTVTDNGSGNLTDVQNIAVTVTDVATVLTGNGIDVQNGQTQRSFVRNLDILFSDSAGLQNLIDNNRLQLTRFDLNGVNGVAVPVPVGTVNGKSIKLDFGIQGIGGPGANRNTNAGDGYYEIAVDADENGSFESIRHFYRLLGDVTGNGTVNGDDKQQILAANGTSSPESDVNGDGSVTALDTALMSRAIGRKLKDELWGLLDD